MDIDHSITLIMAILATAIDSTLDLWLRSIEALPSRAYGDVRVVHPSQIIVFIEYCWLLIADITTTGAVDHTIVPAVDTYLSTGDGHRSRTCSKASRLTRHITRTVFTCHRRANGHNSP